MIAPDIEMPEMAPFFVNVLRQMMIDGKASTQMKADWEIMAHWLQNDGGPLTSEQQEKVRRGWKAYVAIGLAPSFSLQASFDKLSAGFIANDPDCKLAKPPTEVMNVFDRFLATDEMIKEKRAFDIAQERARLEPILASMKRPAPQEGWWRSQPKSFRLAAFACATWALCVSLYVAAFDPFKIGSWGHYNDGDILKLCIIYGLPELAWGIVSVYRRYVR